MSPLYKISSTVRYADSVGYDHGEQRKRHHKITLICANVGMAALGESLLALGDKAETLDTQPPLFPIWQRERERERERESVCV